MISLADWLLQAGIGPAVIALPVNWVASAMAEAAQRWSERHRSRSTLIELARSAAGDTFTLEDSEATAIRELICAPETWQTIAARKEIDLVTQVAALIPPRLGRTSADAEIAARAIVMALAEFTLADLDDAAFERLVLARLDRIDRQVNEHIELVLAQQHADLYVDVGSRARDESARGGRYSALVARLRRLEDLLSPRPAGRRDLRRYLQELVAWLNRDPWPRRWFAGPVLSPSAVECRLQVVTSDGHLLDADQLSDLSHRLVVLGGPGAGKTWFAMRSARRSAERALRALDDGTPISDVEIPIYLSCRDLMTLDGPIDEVIARCSTSLNLGYIASSRLVESISALLASSRGKRFVVLDALDDAPGLDDRRLRQLDSSPWRILLTSRPRTWAEQLTIDRRNPAHFECQLRPFTYPSDVDSVIEAWFASDQRGADKLIEQIRTRVDLQEAASVPLILAFLCVLGGTDPLPRFRRDLYEAIVNRLLSNYWKPGAVPSRNSPDIQKLKRLASSLAWDAATSTTSKGSWRWSDRVDLPIDLQEAELEKLDNLLVPDGPPSLDTGTSFRRFVHRSVQEHLVARHLADSSLFSTSQVVDLVYTALREADWDYVVGPAVAARADKEQVARQVISRLSGSANLPRDIASLDPGEQSSAIFLWGSGPSSGQASYSFPIDANNARDTAARFLIELARESDQVEWPEDFVELTASTRSYVAQNVKAATVEGNWSQRRNRHRAWDGLHGLEGTSHWGDPEQMIVRHLLADLNPASAAQIVPVAARLTRLEENAPATRAHLLRQLTPFTDGTLALELVRGLVSLDPAAEDLALARATVLSAIDNFMQYQPFHFGCWFGPEGLEELAQAFVALSPSHAEKARARSSIVSEVPNFFGGSAAFLLRPVVILSQDATDRSAAGRELLAVLPDVKDGRAGNEVITALLTLKPPTGDRVSAVSMMLDILLQTEDERDARLILSSVAELSTDSAEARVSTRALIVERLVETSEIPTACLLMSTLAELDAGATQREVARNVGLALLKTTHDDGLSEDLAHCLIALADTLEERDDLRSKLDDHISVMTDEWVADAIRSALEVLSSD